MKKSFKLVKKKVTKSEKYEKLKHNKSFKKVTKSEKTCRKKSQTCEKK